MANREIWELDAEATPDGTQVIALQEADGSNEAEKATLANLYLAMTVATAAEINTGTEAAKAMTPDAFVASNPGVRIYTASPVIGYTTNCSTGDGKYYFHIPPYVNGMDLIYVHALCITAGTTNTMDIQIYNLTQTADMLSTKVTIDSGETGSDTAATAYVIDTTNDDVATNDIIRIDIDAVHDTPAKGLVVTLGFRIP